MSGAIPPLPICLHSLCRPLLPWVSCV